MDKREWRIIDSGPTGDRRQIPPRLRDECVSCRNTEPVKGGSEHSGEERPRRDAHRGLAERSGFVGVVENRLLYSLSDESSAGNRKARLERADELAAEKRAAADGDEDGRAREASHHHPGPPGDSAVVGVVHVALIFFELEPDERLFLWRLDPVQGGRVTLVDRPLVADVRVVSGRLNHVRKQRSAVSEPVEVLVHAKDIVLSLHARNERLQCPHGVGFLREARREGLRCVLLGYIHGAHWRSPAREIGS